MKFRVHAIAVLFAMAFMPAAALAAESPLRDVVAGPVDADVVSVVDGDTILVTARPWPQHSIAVLVRIRGIDSPELKSKCPRLHDAAQRARHELERLTASGIRLTNISGDKYFGRVVADVSSSDMRDLASSMIASGLARSYDGGHKAEQDC